MFILRRLKINHNSHEFILGSVTVANRYNHFFCSNLTFFPHILIIRQKTLEVEYLGKLKFVFENNLGNESGDRECAFYEKKTKVANLVQVYLYADSSALDSNRAYSRVRTVFVCLSNNCRNHAVKKEERIGLGLQLTAQ